MKNDIDRGSTKTGNFHVGRQIYRFETGVAGTLSSIAVKIARIIRNTLGNIAVKNGVLGIIKNEPHSPRLSIVVFRGSGKGSGLTHPQISLNVFKDLNQSLGAGKVTKRRNGPGGQDSNEGDNNQKLDETKSLGTRSEFCPPAGGLS